MMTITPRKNAAATKAYVSKQEKTEGREAIPKFSFGKIAKKLGIAGIIDRLTLNRLLDNKTPDGQKLTPRIGKDHVVVHDATFNAPKGTTLASMFSPGGEQIIEAFRESVREAIEAVAEPNAEVRFHPKGKPGATVNVKSAELLVTLDTHLAARKGAHLHGHALIHNVTSSPDGRRLALKPTEIYRNAPKLQKEFHTRFRAKVEALGFPTERRGKFWDISIPRSTINKFSPRRQAIKELYASVAKVTPNLRKKAGIMTRSPKAEVIDLDALKRDCQAQLTPREKRIFETLRIKPKVGRNPNYHRVAYLRQMSNHLMHGRKHELARQARSVGN